MDPSLIGVAYLVTAGCLTYDTPCDFVLNYLTTEAVYGLLLFTWNPYYSFYCIVSFFCSQTQLFANDSASIYNFPCLCFVAAPFNITGYNPSMAATLYDRATFLTLAEPRTRVFYSRIAEVKSSRIDPCKWFYGDGATIPPVIRKAFPSVCRGLDSDFIALVE